MVKFYRVLFKSSKAECQMTSDCTMMYSPPKEVFFLAVDSEEKEEKESSSSKEESPKDAAVKEESAKDAKVERKREFANKFNPGQTFALFNYNRTLVLTADKKRITFQKPGDTLKENQIFVMASPLKETGVEGNLSVTTTDGTIILTHGKAGVRPFIKDDKMAKIAEEMAWSLSFLDTTLRGRPKADSEEKTVTKIIDLKTTVEGNVLEDAFKIAQNEVTEMAPQWFKSRTFEPLSMVFLVINAVQRAGKKLSGADKRRLAIRMKQHAIDTVFTVAEKRHKKDEPPVRKEQIEETFRSYEHLIDSSVYIANNPNDVNDLFKWVSGKFLGMNFF